MMRGSDELARCEGYVNSLHDGECEVKPYTKAELDDEGRRRGPEVQQNYVLHFIP